MSELPPQFQPAKRSQAPGVTGARRVDSAADPDVATGSGSDPRASGGIPPRPASERIRQAPVRRVPLRPGAAGAAAERSTGNPPAGSPTQGDPAAQPPQYSPTNRAGPAAQRPAGSAASAAGTGPGASPTAQPRPVSTRRRWWRARRLIPLGLAVALIALLAWPIGLMAWANSKLNRVDALSDAPSTAGTTYLLAGSDSRSDGEIPDDTQGQRTDTIILLHRAPNGQVALISLPRDTYVAIPGRSNNKLNAAYAFGGAPLLVKTVEGLTGSKIDHYIEVGMGGVRQIVDAVGGVNLCLDYDVNDPKSELVWKSGCHEVAGATALAFARMRYADPLGDIGRQNRQRQLISAIVKSAATPSFLLSPFSQRSVIDAGTSALQVDHGTGIVDLAWLGWYFKQTIGTDGLTGHPPIASYNYRPGKIGQAIKLDTDAAKEFFTKMRAGTLTEADMAVTPGR